MPCALRYAALLAELGDEVRPVLKDLELYAGFSHGSLSHTSWIGMKDRLATLFPNFTAERYDGLHHFNTSHQAEPARVAAALRHHWSRASVGLP